MKSVFIGSGVALITPFDKDGKTDLKGFEKLIEYQLNALKKITSVNSLFTYKEVDKSTYLNTKTEIKKYEREYEFEVVSDEKIDEIKQAILQRRTNLKCPMCGEPLVTRIARMYDLEDNLVLQPKAHCVKCIFQIKN